MLSPQLNNQLNALYDLNFELSEALTDELLASEVEGEKFHPDYKKNKKHFVRLIKSAVKTERGINKVHKELAQDIWKYINWNEYNQRMVKGATLMSGVSWKDVEVGLMVTFTDTLDDAFEVGGLAAEVELGTTIGFSVAEPAVQKALKNYTIKLAGDITDHTRQLVQTTIARSLSLGENQQEATDRLASIIVDRKRAGKIAHTEAVRAYSAGRMEAGAQIGARFKVWRNGQPGACPICTGLHGQKVKLNESFKSDIGDIEYAPAHPWCRCLTGLEM